VTARACHFVEIDERFDRKLLRVKVHERATIGQAVVGVKPMVEQNPRRFSYAFVI